MYQKQPHEVITGPDVRLSYCNLLEPRAAKGSEKKQFSVKLLIPKTDEYTKSQLREAIAVARANGVTEGKKPFKDFPAAKLASMTLRIEDGDDPKFADQPECHGCIMINAKSPSDKPPGILTEEGVRVVKGGPNETQIYSGMYARVLLQLFAFDNMTQGISAAVINVKKTRDGEPFGGGKRPSAEDVFETEGSPFETAGAPAAAGAGGLL